MAREDPPKYRQIAGDLRALIERGDYPPGARLPPKAALMAEYGVALNTVDNALGVLRDLGLIETRQGVGTFVCDPLPSPQPSAEYQAVMERIDGIAEEVRQLRDEVAEMRRAVAK
jgi:DNA-binding GntR family transcriptional regulator